MSIRSFTGFVLAALSLVLALAGCVEEKATNPTPGHELDSPALLGATAGSRNYLHTFTGTGSYPYHCSYHTTAEHREGGTVVVDASGQDSVFVSVLQGAFHPATAVVKPGGHVRWQNFDDGVHHTVTSD